MSRQRRHRGPKRWTGGPERIFGAVAVFAALVGVPSVASAERVSAQVPGRVEAAVTIPPTDTIAVTPVGPAAEPTGAWLCPVPGPVFTNDWGQPRSGGRRHEGTDLLAGRGTPVIASVAGMVKRSTSSSGGLTFNLTGADGFTYVGMHLSAYGAEGQVAGGDVIGYVGDSGNARGTNHLHFEIHAGKGVKLNPFATLRRYC